MAIGSAMRSTLSPINSWPVERRQDQPDTVALWNTILGSSKAARAVTRLGRQVRTMSAGELAALPQVGIRNARKVVATLDVARHLLSEPLDRGKPIKGAQDVFAAYGHRLADRERETFWAIYLDTKNRVISEEMVTVGSVDQCPVAPGDVLRIGLRVAAVGLIALHNHPSGVPEPSSHDDALTKRLSDAAELVGITLVDHLIIGDGRYFSFADAGRLHRQFPNNRPYGHRRFHVHT